MTGAVRARRLNVGVTLALLYLAAMFTTTSKAQELQDLDPLRWERRVLVVFTTDATGASVVEALERGRMELDDRDVSWFVIRESRGWRSNHALGLSPGLVEELQSLRASPGADVETLLVGKDGTLKSREAGLDLEAVYDRIDGMPMRRREQREREAAAGG